MIKIGIERRRIGVKSTEIRHKNITAKNGIDVRILSLMNGLANLTVWNMIPTHGLRLLIKKQRKKKNFGVFQNGKERYKLNNKTKHSDRKVAFFMQKNE